MRERLTLQAAAKRLGVTITTVVNWESGANRPTPRSMTTINLVAGITSVQWLNWLDAQTGSR